MNVIMVSLSFHKRFKRQVCIKDNTVATEEFIVEGRKIPLHDIRKKMFHDHQNYMQLHTDEEIESCDEITLIDMLKKRKTFPSKKYFIDKI